MAVVSFKSLLKKLMDPAKRMLTGAASTGITVHPDTEHPSKVWSKLAVKQTVQTVLPLAHDTPVSEDKLRVVCISDTHSEISRCPECVPPGDILLHAGDFSRIGHPAEVVQFNEFLGNMVHPVKIVIAGNHDLTFDDDLLANDRPYLKNNFRLTEKNLEGSLEKLGVSTCKELLTNCVYLEDAGIDVCGVKIYGSPWQPEFCGWGFNLPRGEKCLEKWSLIPDDTDILMTHGPPIGHGDKCFDGMRVGCVELLATIQQRVKPRYHVFGHIHEAYGITTDGMTTYINASTCTLRYKPTHPPIIFDIAIPEGHMKSELADTKPCRLIRKA